MLHAVDASRPPTRRRCRLEVGAGRAVEVGAGLVHGAGDLHVSFSNKSQDIGDFGRMIAATPGRVAHLQCGEIPNAAALVGRDRFTDEPSAAAGFTAGGFGAHAQIGRPSCRCAASARASAARRSPFMPHISRGRRPRREHGDRGMTVRVLDQAPGRQISIRHACNRFQTAARMQIAMPGAPPLVGPPGCASW